MKTFTPTGIPSLAVAEGATTPAPGYSAWIWSTTLNRPMFWNGARWQAAAPVTVGTTAPSSPSVGDLWVDTN